MPPTNTKHWAIWRGEENKHLRRSRSDELVHGPQRDTTGCATTGRRALRRESEFSDIVMSP